MCRNSGALIAYTRGMYTAGAVTYARDSRKFTCPPYTARGGRVGGGGGRGGGGGGGSGGGSRGGGGGGGEVGVGGGGG